MAASSGQSRRLLSTAGVLPLQLMFALMELLCMHSTSFRPSNSLRSPCSPLSHLSLKSFFAPLLSAEPLLSVPITFTPLRSFSSPSPFSLPSFFSPLSLFLLLSSFSWLRSFSLLSVEPLLSVKPLFSAETLLCQAPSRLLSLPSFSTC